MRLVVGRVTATCGDATSGGAWARDVGVAGAGGNNVWFWGCAVERV